METVKPILIKIKKGLDLPITGYPEQVVRGGKYPRTVAVLGIDYAGMKPRFSVLVNEYVKLGQPLFHDKKVPSVQYTAPGAGEIIEINRGEKRRLISVVVRLDGDEEISFESYGENKLASLPREHIVKLLLESGMWTSIRARPFSKVPDPGSVPHSLFITAMDSNPLAPLVPRTIEGRERHFMNGMTVLSRLTQGTVYLCKTEGDGIPVPEVPNLSVHEFSGPHPAGNVGTHIHFLDPVSSKKQVWYINAQDVIAVGALFTSGRLHLERVIALGGPSVKNPRLVRTRTGASVEDITANELSEGDHRIISGSVFSGHTARGAARFLGRFHQQISVLPEEGRRQFLGWLRPGLNEYSVKNIVLSRLFPGKKFTFTTSTHGEKRSIVPVGAYEKVMPLDIMPTHLLKALAVDDIEEAQRLGCLELDEEDIALCTFVCQSKQDHGSALRRNLSLIEKEGL